MARPCRRHKPARSGGAGEGRVIVRENIQAKAVGSCTPATGAANVTLDRIALSYNPLDDTMRLRNNPQDFEAQRNHYALRHEVESAKP